MPAPRCRPFTVLDAMILVAATAGGLCWLDENALDNIRAAWRGEIAPTPAWLEYSGLGVRVAAPAWFAWTVALGLLRLRAPRPPLRRLRRQPGLLAAATIVGLFLLLCGCNWGQSLWSLAEGRLDDGFPWNPFSPNLAWQLLFFGPTAVIGGWLTLFLSGRWRPEPGWIDRSARFLGWGWIACVVLRPTLWGQYLE